MTRVQFVREKNMKKILSMSIIVLAVSLFTGCIDVIQVVSIKNGTIHTSVRYSLQKAIFELGASFSGEEIDYDEMLEIGDDTFAQIGGVSGEVKKYETPYDIGAEITFIGDQRTLTSMLEDEVEFIPIKKNNAYYIEIPLLGESGEDVDENELGFLGSSKYRLVVSLSDDLRNISKADITLHLSNGFNSLLTTESGISISTIGSIMMIEIPMSVLFIDEGEIIVKLS